MPHENIEVGGSDMLASFRLAFAGAEGVTGLPILQEISLALFVILSLLLWLLNNSRYSTRIVGRRKKKGEYRHLALPALVLSRGQRQKLSKLLLPASCVEEISPASGSEDDKEVGKEKEGLILDPDAPSTPDGNREGDVRENITAENNETTDTTSGMNASVTEEKENPKKLISESPSKSESKDDIKSERSGSLRESISAITPALRRRVKGIEKQVKRKLKYRRGHSGRKRPMRYVDSEKSRDILRGKTPLLVFVNKKSGGQQGELLLYQLRALLHSWQVYDLKKGHGPEVGLKFFAKVPMFRILVAGGDGTIAWVLETLDKLKFEYRPPVAVLPLGTGNDLARVLGWGGGLHVGSSSTLPLVSQLFEVAKSQLTLLDRWNVTFSDKTQSISDELASATTPLPNNGEGNDNKGLYKAQVMNNYIGVGVDAQIALNFHLKRERAPHLFTNRFINKFWYASSGGQEILMQRFIDFATHVTLECDGKRIALPIGCEGIIVLNIDSYGGGVDLWCGKNDDDTNGENNVDDDMDTQGMHRSRSFSFDNQQRLKHAALGGGLGNKNQSFNDDYKTQFRKKNNIQTQKFSIPSYQDRLLEVVGVASSFQLGAAQVGLARPTRLCQGRNIRITTAKSLPVQIDGEPSVMEPNQSIAISHRNQCHMLSMAHLVDEIDKHKVTADVIDWAFTGGIIKASQRDLLLAEISRRIQYARVRSISLEDEDGL